MIKKAPDTESARNALCDAKPATEVADFVSLIDDPGHAVIDERLSETQAQAILELRLQRLTGMERDKLSAETRELANKITTILIFWGRSRVSRVVLDELAATRERLANPRRTEITDQLGDQDDEDLIQQEDMVVTVVTAVTSNVCRYRFIVPKDAVARDARA